MFTILLAIAAAVIFLLGIAYFFSDSFASLLELWNSAYSAVTSFLSMYPDWFYAFVVVGLLVAVVSLVVKLI